MCFVDDNRQFCVPGLNFIDALHTTGKIRDYLTCNIEAPELSKNRNLNKPKQAWLGLERAQSFFKFLGVSNLNAENIYTFLCLHTLPINLYAMRNTGGGGFNATYLIPIEPTPESQIMPEVKTFLTKVQKMITRTPTEERTPKVVPFTKVELTDDERESLRYLDVINYNPETTTVYLEVAWYQEYDFETKRPFIYAHLSTAVVRTSLSAAERAWFEQRKNSLAQLI